MGTGTIRAYDAKKGFGFILPDDSPEDLFFLRTAQHGCQRSAFERFFNHFDGRKWYFWWEKHGIFDGWMVLDHNLFDLTKRTELPPELDGLEPSRSQVMAVHFFDSFQLDRGGSDDVRNLGPSSWMIVHSKVSEQDVNFWLLHAPP